MDVIIYHEGGFDGLKWCIESLRTHSPQSRIILIGKDVPVYEVIPEGDLLESWNRFEPFYEHHSINPPEFEKRCFRRWFVTMEYVKRSNIRRFMAIDSDVLTFCNLRETGFEIEAMLRSGDFRGEVIVPWIFTRRGIELFCAFMHRVYESKSQCEEWKRIMESYVERRVPVITDIGLIDEFLRPCKHLNLFDPNGRNDVFDNNICLTGNGFMSHLDRKRIVFWGGLPYAMTSDRRIVRMNSLHCWGPYKQQMEAIWKRSIESLNYPDPQFWP